MSDIIVSNISNYISECDKNIIIIYRVKIGSIKYAARLFINDMPTKYSIVAYTLKNLRKKIPKNFKKIKRHKNDNINIVGIYYL